MKKIVILVVLTFLSGSLGASKPIGLRNVGNSCFMNAALQCLLTVDELTATVLAKSPTYYTSGSISTLYKSLLEGVSTMSSSTYDATPFSEKSWRALLVEQFTKTRCTSYDTMLFAQKGWQILQAGRGTQQDSAEFIDCLFKHLADYDIDSTIRATLPSYSHTRQPKTDISALFMTLESSTIIPAGLACRAHKKIEPCSMLHLSLDSSSKTLGNCLSSYFMPEILNGKNQYKLGGRFVDAIKVLSLTHLPLYLVFDLKLVNNLFSYTKLSCALSFPLEGLALTSYMDSSVSTDQEQYSLASFIVHSGSAFCGHYTAYVKRNNQWYYCNDETITPISNEDMQTIAKRGFGLDPAFIEGINAFEDLRISVEQTPVLFFYKKNIPSEKI